MNITKKDIEQSIGHLNDDLGENNCPWYRDTEGALRSNEGTFHLSQAYGGYSLHRMASDRGASIDVFGCGHVPRRQLHGLIRAFSQGIYTSINKETE